MGRKKELGKGIRALLSNIETTNSPTEKKELVKELNSSIMEIKIDSIETNPFQPRSEFDKQMLDELSQSIKVHGVIQAITVRSLGGDKYQLISGERRLRASKMAGLKKIPAFVRVADDQAMLEMALIENIQRADLNAVEVAISYKRLMEECDLTHEELSTRVGKNRSTITNYVRLLKLPPQIQTAVKDNVLSMGHARALAGIDNIDMQLEIYKEATDKKLSVRALETLIKSYNGSEKSTSNAGNAAALPAEVLKIRDRLSGKLGTKIDIKRNDSGKGQFVIKFANDSEFNLLVSALESIE